MIEEQCVSFETAKLAKEKGFDIWCEHSYTLEEHHFFNDCYSKNDANDSFLAAPTQSLLARWLREKHKMIVSCVFNYETKMWVYFIGNYNNPISKSDKEYDSYEEAMEDGLQEALKLLS